MSRCGGRELKFGLESLRGREERKGEGEEWVTVRRLLKSFDNREWESEDEEVLVKEAENAVPRREVREEEAEDDVDADVDVSSAIVTPR